MAYSYLAPNDGESYQVGDLVMLRSDAIGQIVEVDVPEDKIGFPVEKLKAFIGRAVNPEVQIPEANKVIKPEIHIPEAKKGE